MAFDFASVIPFWSWGLIGLALFLMAYFISLVIKQFREWVGAFDSRQQDRVAERQVEGIFWGIAEILRLILATVVIIIGYTLFRVFTGAETRDPYGLVLGQFTWLTVMLLVAIYLCKTLPWIARRRKVEGGEEEEGAG